VLDIVDILKMGWVVESIDAGIMKL
jgi:hypothetical protein